MNQTEKELKIYRLQKEKMKIFDSPSLDLVFNEYKYKQIHLDELKQAIAFQIAKNEVEAEK